MSRAEQEAWMAQWRVAAPQLLEIHHRELRGLTDEQALHAADALLSLAAGSPYSEERRRHSGLVDQQALFHGRQL
jgi:hypothetical protein